MKIRQLFPLVALALVLVTITAALMMKQPDGPTLPSTVQDDSTVKEVSPPKENDPAITDNPLMTVVFSEVTANLSRLSQNDRVVRLERCFALIREHPDAGINWARRFFESGEDAVLTDYRVTDSNEGFATAQTFRVALLLWLRHIQHPAIAILSGEVLSHTHSMIEANVTAELLSAYSPTDARSQLAQTALRLTSEPPTAFDGNLVSGREKLYLDAMSFSADATLLPHAREIVRKNNMLTPQYLAALQFFSPEVRAEATLELLDSPTLVKVICDRFSLLPIDLASPVVRQKILGNVFPKLSDNSKAALVVGPSRLQHEIWYSFTRRAESVSVPHVSLEGWSELLDAVIPFANTPDLQRRLAETRRHLPERIAEIERLYPQRPIAQ